MKPPLKSQVAFLALLLNLNVPFVVQAPLKEWNNPRFQDACEETSVYMAMKWVNSDKIGNSSSSLKIARDDIMKMSLWESTKYNNYHDTSATDTAERLIKNYYGYKNFTIKKNVQLTDIVAALKNNELVIVPTNGQLLHNPYFTAPGPLNHMLVIKGYDARQNIFITNDPGTKRGENFQYAAKTLDKAISDYPTGDHKMRKNLEKTAIFVKK
jgi:hypothetical protein